MARTNALDLLGSVCWYGYILHVYRRTLSAGGPSPVFRTMGLVAALVIVITFLLPHGAVGTSAWSIEIAIRLSLAICKLLLIENLYLNTPAHLRWHVALPCVALGALAGFDIVLTADAILAGVVSPVLIDARALATLICAPVLAVAAARDRRWRIDIHVSRTAVFHSATLVLSGLLLLSLAAVGEKLRRSGGGWGAVADASLLFAGIMAVGLLVTSGAARSRLKSLIVDNFFSNRYDYRKEWLRCIDTLSDTATTADLHARVIRAVADTVDSPGGMLFLREPGESVFAWAGSWNMQTAALPVAVLHPLVSEFRQGGWIVELGASDLAPPLDRMRDCWLAVPLATDGQVSGFMILSRSRAPFALDNEVFNLLRTLGREAMTYLAEQRATRQITQTRQLHAYSKRFAFVAHDIKNVSSQLQMLMANAEVHIANPAFQADMLGTIGASVQKINTLLRRLDRPEVAEAGLLAVTPRVQSVVTQFGHPKVQVTVVFDGEAPPVSMVGEAFDSVLTHLLNNAAESSTPPRPIIVRVASDSQRVIVDVVDQGDGMTAEFVRDDLFRPFRTSKTGGSGIGAFQARELLREAGGDLLVLSRPGQGTTMRMVLPACDDEAHALGPSAGRDAHSAMAAA